MVAPTSDPEALMPTAAYEAAEMRASGQKWYCWSVIIEKYWKPRADYHAYAWVAHDDRCGWMPSQPTPFAHTEEGAP